MGICKTCSSVSLPHYNINISNLQKTLVYIPLLRLSMSAAALGLVFLLLTIFSFVFVYISYGKLGSKGTGKKLEGVICL